MKKIIASAVIFIILICSITVPSMAAGTTIGLSAKSIETNSTLTVTVTVNAGVEMYGAQFKVKYNPEVLKFKSGDSATGDAGVVTVASAVSGLKKTSFVLNFSAIASGSSGISVSECIYVGLDDGEKEVSGSGVNITVKDKTKSNNANLEALKLSVGTLSPAFSPNATSYKVTIPYSADQCKLYTKTSDDEAKITVEGSSTMKVGKNTRTIIVTAPSGNQKRYKIEITRLSEAESPTEQEENTDKTFTISGTDYEILDEIPEDAIPSSFVTASAEINGKTVPVAEDENGKYLIYYLKNTTNSKTGLFTYNSDDSEFSPLPFIKSGNDMYILEDVEDAEGTPQGAEFTTAQINGYHVNAFIPENDNMNGFYYIRCYINGNSGYYRYDSEMKTIQRELGLVFGGEMASTEVEVPAVEMSASERFQSLDATAKIVVVALALIVLVIIALIVLVIIQAVKSRKADEFYNQQNDASLVENSGFIFDPEDIEETSIACEQPIEETTETKEEQE